MIEIQIPLIPHPRVLKAFPTWVRAASIRTRAKTFIIPLFKFSIMHLISQSTLFIIDTGR